MGSKLSHRVVDIHCHILPAVDDGSSGIEESLEMLKIASSEGITDLVLTPHFKIERHNASIETINERFELLKQKVKENNIDVKLSLGNEVMYYGEMLDQVKEGRIKTMNNTKYVMIEFMPQESYSYVKRAVLKVLSAGLIPVIAHVERYDNVGKYPERVEDLINNGAKIQMNASSITGKYGFGVKRICKKLLFDGLVDYIGTDAHNKDSRSPKMSKCIAYLYKKLDADYVEDILFKNAIEDFGI